MKPIAGLDSQEVSKRILMKTAMDLHEPLRRGWALTLVAFAVGTYLVGLELQQTFDGLLVLRSLVRRSTSRHNPWPR